MNSPEIISLFYVPLKNPCISLLQHSFLFLITEGNYIVQLIWKSFTCYLIKLHLLRYNYLYFQSSPFLVDFKLLEESGSKYLLS